MTTAAANHRFTILLRRAQVLFVVLCCTMMALYYAACFYIAMRCPLSLTYEHPIVWYAWELIHGGNLYDPRSLYSPPWVVNAYTPLLYVLSAPGMLIWGPCLAAPRLVLIVASIALAWTMVCFFRRCGCSRVATACGVMFFFSFIPVWYNTFVAKPDILAQFFAVIMMGCLLCAPDAFKGRRFWFSIVCAVLILMTKQNLMIMAVGVSLYLAVKRRWRDCLKFTAAWAIVGGGLCVVLQLVSGGLFQHLFFFGSKHFHMQLELLNWRAFGVDGLKLLLAAVFVIVYALADRDQRDEFTLPVAVLAIVAPFSFYVLGLPACMTNHLIPAIFLVSWLVAIALTRYEFAALAVASTSVIFLPDTLQYLWQQGHNAADSRASTLAILPKGGSLLAEDAYWSFQNNSKAMIVDCSLFANVWRRKPQLMEPFIKQLQSKYYDAVMINARDDAGQSADIWTPDMVRLIHDNYRLAGHGMGNGLQQNIYLRK